MILADKIIQLRKKNGWSQEELAAKMNVSRQAVSKWEGAQTVPDIGKILQLGMLFGVSTDYLLKDEIENEDYVDGNTDSPIYKVSLDSAHQYLSHRRWAAKRIALAVFLCILAPAVLFMLIGFADTNVIAMGENTATLIGLLVLSLFVLIAVPIFISVGFKHNNFKFLQDNNPFDLEYGVSGMVHEKQKAFNSTYIKSNIVATCLCIISPVPMVLAAIFDNEMLIFAFLALFLLLAGLGVYIFIRVGVQNESMKRLLKQGDEYDPASAEKNKAKDLAISILWAIVILGYFFWSYFGDAWDKSWVILLAGGILTPIVSGFFSLKNNRSSTKDQ